MAILPDHLLRERLADRSLIVDPLGPGAIQPSSIDLRLGSIIKVATPDGFEEYDLAERGRQTTEQRGWYEALMNVRRIRVGVWRPRNIDAIVEEMR